MFKCDYHTHTYFSFDAEKESTPEALCEAAIARGITDLAITDHFECNWRVEGIAPPYRFQEAQNAIMNAKEKYKSKINLTYGIELGQAVQYPEEAKELISSCQFEFILGSLHNLRSAPDFYYLDFKKIDSDRFISHLFNRYISEIEEMVKTFDNIDTVAHLTYIQRYIELAGKKYDFTPHYQKISELFKKMISKDIALEVNVSTLWSGLGFSMPSYDILSLYRDCGGRLITVGTDSHSPLHVGECIDEAFSLLKTIGLNDILVVRNGEKTVVKI